jgi:hypothetical protein
MIRSWLITLFLIATVDGCQQKTGPAAQLEPHGSTQQPSDSMPFIRVSSDSTAFVVAGTNELFRPWGFNYDHDADGKLLEDYWETDWPRVESDFAEMKALGANVVRIHLQFGKFMIAPDRPNPQSLDRLAKLVDLAERTGLYLDLTGLGCYHKADVPDWYDGLAEEERWNAQARFWEAVAERCRNSPAIFCYDLMNEPVIPGGKRADRDWLGPAFASKHFVQFVTLDQNNRARPQIARSWIQHLVRAIRKHDERHLITIGLVDWSLDRPGLTSGFVPEAIVSDLDFLAVHIYPEKGKINHSLETLRAFAVGKPVLVEETFPLKCSSVELEELIDRAGPLAAGWLSFYWGRTPDELRLSQTLPDAILLDWLIHFQKRKR